MKNLRFLFVAPLFFACASGKTPDNSGFVELSILIPSVLTEVRYVGYDNFLGVPVDGYEEAKIFLTKEAASALKVAQTELAKQGLGLKVFDGYRPQRAVDHFVRWGKEIGDTLTKSKYYPDISKSEVFELGFVATRSSHSRGSTLDLTLINLIDSSEVDMGSPFDFFGSISHHDSHLLDSIPRKNRLLLKETMIKAGFRPYQNEWWHYTLENEPYPDTYFDFPIK